MSGNREYKSDVFSMLMENPQNALDLYNAVNHSSYTDPDLVEINTLRKGISLTIRNDASFVLDMNLSIYEHQSTVCPNMPVRSLVYLGHALDDMVKQMNIYGRYPVKIPTPHFVVFYNGEEEQPERSEQRLSDLFAKPTEQPELELVCTVYNINNGKNEKLLSDCPFLREYMTFVTYVRENCKRNKKKGLGQAVEEAIDRCIRENILREFLISRRAEVVKEMVLDYTFDRRLELERRDSRAEGRKEGIAEGRKEGIAEGRKEGRKEGIAEGRKEGLDEGLLRGQIQLICRKMQREKTFEQIVDETEMPGEKVQVIYDMVCKFAPEYNEEQIYKALSSLEKQCSLANYERGATLGG